MLLNPLYISPFLPGLVFAISCYHSSLMIVNERKIVNCERQIHNMTMYLKSPKKWLYDQLTDNGLMNECSTRDLGRVEHLATSNIISLILKVLSIYFICCHSLNYQNLGLLIQFSFFLSIL